MFLVCRRLVIGLRILLLICSLLFLVLLMYLVSMQFRLLFVLSFPVFIVMCSFCFGPCPDFLPSLQSHCYLQYLGSRLSSYISSYTVPFSFSVLSSVMFCAGLHFLRLYFTTFLSSCFAFGSKLKSLKLMRNKTFLYCEHSLHLRPLRSKTRLFDL